MTSASASSAPDSPDLIIASPSGDLSGAVTLPGDKSISHRALIFGALSIGETHITGLLEGEDVLGTARICGQLGAQVERLGAGEWRVRGRGVQGLSAPEDILDFGNSGTGVRLMLGVLAGHPFRAMLTGDASLRSRPMGRAVAPLELMGARTDLSAGGRLPGSIMGGDPLRPIRYTVPVPSAQVKSAVLLAGLHAPGRTSVVETVATRDHTERMLARLGVTIETAELPGGAREITVEGQPELTGIAFEVPGDPSSAAFPMVAACLRGGSVEIANVLMNPMRTGLITTLEEMGARIERLATRDAGGEPVADLRVSAPDGLTGVTVPAARAPSMIDEYPVLAVAAAFARGRTHMPGIGELRVKESDRLEVMARGLAACGAKVEAGADELAVEGTGGLEGGATIDAVGDHRIAMSFLVAGLGARSPVRVTGARSITTSFPQFTDTMRALGAQLAAGQD